MTKDQCPLDVTGLTDTKSVSPNPKSRDSRLYTTKIVDKIDKDLRAVFDALSHIEVKNPEYTEVSHNKK